MKEPSSWEKAAAKILSSYAVATFAFFWVGLILALLINRDWLSLLWDWVGSLPSLVRIIIWVVLLPVMVGLWIWHSSWPVLGRILGFAGIMGWTLIAVNSLIKAFRKILLYEKVRKNRQRRYLQAKARRK